jgi:hypothetical protein
MFCLFGSLSRVRGVAPTGLSMQNGVEKMHEKAYSVRVEYEELCGVRHCFNMAVALQTNVLPQRIFLTGPSFARGCLQFNKALVLLDISALKYLLSSSF